MAKEKTDEMLTQMDWEAQCKRLQANLDDQVEQNKSIYNAAAALQARNEKLLAVVKALVELL